MKLSHILSFVGFMTLVPALGGCALTTTDKAIIAANEIHDLAAGEAKIISTYCDPKYQAVKTKADLAAVDNVCKPAEASYYAVKLAWQTLSSVIEASKAGVATDVQVQTALNALNSVIADFQKIVQTLSTTQVATQGAK